MRVRQHVPDLGGRGVGGQELAGPSEAGEPSQVEALRDELVEFRKRAILRIAADISPPLANANSPPASASVPRTIENNSESEGSPIMRLIQLS